MRALSTLAVSQDRPARFADRAGGGMGPMGGWVRYSRPLLRGRAAAALRQKGVQCAFGLSGQQTPSDVLRAIYHVIEGSNAQLVAVQLHNDIATVFQADRLAELHGDDKESPDSETLA
jgi:hypothetical protein